VRRRGGVTALAAVALLASSGPVTGCAVVKDAPPGCGQPLRLAIIAQSVPGAAYVPCLYPLPPGWSASAFTTTRGSTSFLLNSDRSPGQPVAVRLAGACRTGSASPSPPRAAGVLTYLKLISISPRYAGSLYDVFPGGCVRYRFSFQQGSTSISLMEQFESAVGLYPRQQLRIIVKKELGVELSP
jgi:hypothetical protein